MDRRMTKSLQGAEGIPFVPTLLSPSKPNKELSLYQTVSLIAVNSALIQEEDHIQLPIYYTSRVLRGEKGRYPPTEKLAFTLITSACKLRPYFQAHTIVVQTDKPLCKAMNKPEAAKQLVLCTIELSEFDVQYQSRTTFKAQALADFVIEFTTNKDKGWGPTLWLVRMGGSPNRHVEGIGVDL